ncbi:hypothetical protein IC620_15220 [Hazenella sp. IB182357]|uniref:Uncharacterized protein n=1 Tax=Polycladospora coralii TaxID=2771432 RepID=A0A926RU93_9BACL|nr:hypothetical protein [Polycladospora coralii]MBD1373695.1 hypothetical protein [Polycladospora coralii]
MKYFREAKDVWKNYVPKEGQSSTVEGELIRAIEKLRYEAQNNGNGNYDFAFNLFCTYIEETLSDPNVFDSKVLKQIQEDVQVLRNYKQPYLSDDLYDRLTDFVIEWSRFYRGPIYRAEDPKQYR